MHNVGVGLPVLVGTAALQHVLELRGVMASANWLPSAVTVAGLLRICCLSGVSTVRSWLHTLPHVRFNIVT